MGNWQFWSSMGPAADVASSGLQQMGGGGSPRALVGEILHPGAEESPKLRFRNWTTSSSGGPMKDRLS